MTPLRCTITFLLLAITWSLPTQAVEISNLRVAFELTGNHILVREMIVINSAGRAQPPSNPIVIPFPKGAEAPRLAEDQPLTGIVLTAKGVMVAPPQPEAGVAVPLMFELPIRDGAVVFDHRLPLPIKLAHAAFAGEGPEIKISGDGFGAPSPATMLSGIPAILTVGQNFEDGHIRLALEGFGRDWMKTLSALATATSFGILAVGLFLWLRRRKEA